MENKPTAAGKSSFELIDPGTLFAALPLPKGSVLLDLACGRGAYAIALAEYMGGGGKIYAVDLWKEGIDALRTEISARKIGTVTPLIADVSKKLPLENGSIDVCLAATVLHDLVEDGTEKGTLQEIRRVLKPGGTLAVVEFKKVQGPPGPPVEIRLAPLELEELVAPYGFRPVSTTDAGPYNYLSLFMK